MRGKSKLTLAIVGSVTSLLLGTGLLALTSDTVFSNGNSLESGTFSPASPTPPPEPTPTPQSYDLVAGKTVFGMQGCDGVTYTDGPLTATAKSADLNTPSNFLLAAGDDYCLKNNSSQTGRLTIAFANASPTDIACSNGEAEAGDSTCGSGLGELQDILFVQIRTGFATPGSGTTAASCNGGLYRSFATYQSGMELDATIAPGEICRAQWEIFFKQGVTDAEKLKAQTDKVQWDMAFTLQD